MPIDSSNQSQDRPDFMVRLGLAPPYAMEDIKKAYLEQVMLVHPDHGGSVAEFRALQEAFEQATRHLEFRCDRREWIAQNIDDYVSMQELVHCLDRYGAQVTTNAIDWLEQSFGEFAQLTESILAVRLDNSSHADEVITTISKESSVLKSMTRLELPGCQVSDEAVLKLSNLRNLQHLDLSDTSVTKKVLELVPVLTELKSLNLQGSKVSWLQQKKAQGILKKRASAGPLPTASRRPSS